MFQEGKDILMEACSAWAKEDEAIKKVLEDYTV